jgi:hypothetical protein
VSAAVSATALGVHVGVLRLTATLSATALVPRRSVWRHPGLSAEVSTASLGVAGDGVEDVGDRVVRDRAGDVGDAVVVASLKFPTASLEMLLSAMLTVLISAMVSMLRWRIRRRRRRCLLVQVTAR